MASPWLKQQRALLLPAPYFLVTFTLPAGLRTVARRHQRVVYGLFFRAAAEALQQLAADERFVGGQIGLVGGLQSWTRDLRYPPHLHFLVPGGGLSAEGQRWLPSHANFLVRVEPLGMLLRAKFRDGRRKRGLFHQVPSAVWSQAWGVDCRPVGNGETVLKYLAPYIFRIALSNHRILKLENEQVTFRYQEGQSKRWRTATLAVFAFIRHFLQHVLPKGFVKVRSYGLLAVGNRQRLRLAQARLGTPPPSLPRRRLSPATCPSGPRRPSAVLSAVNRWL